MRFSTGQAATAIGISRNTLLRWFREGRVADVARDRNGWRFFTSEDVRRIRAFANSQTPAKPVRTAMRDSSEVAG